MSDARRRPMRLYDTARRAVVPFDPAVERLDVHVRDHAVRRDPPRPRGDVPRLRRAAATLIDRGHTVTCVRNVTDVDDPLFAKARQLGVHYLDLAAGEEARFEADMAALNALPVVSTPRASSAIPDIRGFIGMVLDRGYAYQANGRGLLRRLPVRVVRHASATTAGTRCSRSPASAAATSTTRQARPARLRAVAAVGSRRAVVGHAVGAGPAGLAHRVQRARAA